MKSENDWLASLAVGDEVVVVTGGTSDRYDLATVERFTATQIVCNGRHYRKSDGYAVQNLSRWYRTRLTSPTPELRERIARAGYFATVKYADFAKLTTDQLARIAAIIAEPPIAA